MLWFNINKIPCFINFSLYFVFCFLDIYYILPFDFFTLILLFFLVCGGVVAWIIDFRLFLFSNVGFWCYKFPSQHCFSCVLGILIWCIFIFIWFNVFFKISLEPFFLFSRKFDWFVPKCWEIILLFFGYWFLVWFSSGSKTYSALILVCFVAYILVYVWLKLVSSILRMLKQASTPETPLPGSWLSACRK